MRFGSIIFFLFVSFCAFAQEDTVQCNKSRLRTVLIAEGVSYGATMIGFNSLWYKDYPKSAFHFFDDSDEWLQMDKLGHMMGTYYMSKTSGKIYEWCGMDHKKATIYGSLGAFVSVSSIEIFDGFSEEWGASVSDLLANSLGASLYTFQELAWNEQRIKMKFSFHQTEYASMRPNVLGENFIQQSLKDYNGQTYWMSFNLYSIFQMDNHFPKWLNLAIGYGADGMTGGKENPLLNAVSGNFIYTPSIPDRQRQYYLSLDIDLSKIKSRSKVLNHVLSTFNFIKIPFPALQLQHGNLNAKGFYF